MNIRGAYVRLGRGPPRLAVGGSEKKVRPGGLRWVKSVELTFRKGTGQQEAGAAKAKLFRVRNVIVPEEGLTREKGKSRSRAHK